MSCEFLSFLSATFFMLSILLRPINSLSKPMILRSHHAVSILLPYSSYTLDMPEIYLEFGRVIQNYWLINYFLIVNVRVIGVINTTLKKLFTKPGCLNSL
jgi:hypothetical protein